MSTSPTSGGMGGTGGAMTTSVGGGGGIGGLAIDPWIHTFKGEGLERARAVAVGPDDGILLGGLLTSTVAFGDKQLPFAGAKDGYAVHLTSDGIVDWAMAFSGDDAEPAGQAVEDVAIDGDGSMIVAGGFQGKVVLSPEGATLTGTAGYENGFVAKYDAGGTYLWGVGFHSPDTVLVGGAALTKEGDVVVVGNFYAKLDFNDVTLQVPQAQNSNSFVAKLAKDTGQTLWVKQVSTTMTLGGQLPLDVAVDPIGNIAVVGQYTGEIVYGGCTAAWVGSYDAFVLQLTPDGDCISLKGFGGVSNENVQAVTAMPNGDVYAAGVFQESIVFEGMSYTNSAASDGVFLARFAVDGTLLSSTAVKDMGFVSGAMVGLVPMPGNSGFVLASAFSASPDFGDGIPLPADNQDAFVLRLDANGNYVSHVVYGGAGDQRASAVAADSKGALIVAGDFSGPTNLGNGIVDGNDDIFLLKISP